MFRPDLGFLEQRALLSALPTLTALRASAASAVSGQSVTFTATVSDLSAGGAIPTGGTVTFSDQGGAIGTANLVNGVAEFTTTGLPAGADTITGSYGGTAAFAPSTTGTIVTAVGNGTAGYTGNNGPATAAEMKYPVGISFDSAGNLFIADASNNVVREVVKATGDIITVAGNGKAGYSGNGGPATDAELNFPNGIAFDSAGNMFIEEGGNNVIREVVKATGDITTAAGNGTAGYGGDGGPAIEAELNSPRGIAIDSAGNLFIADTLNNRIREVVKATGNIITVAGNGTAGLSGDNGPAADAEVDDPTDVALDSAGDLFLTDYAKIREVVKATADIVTIAGNGTFGYSGDGGPATAAEFGANGVAVDAQGDLYIADYENSVVREVVKATGDIITVAGNGTVGYGGDGGLATAAELTALRVAVDSAGDVFVADANNNVVRELTPAVTVNVSSSSALPTLTAIVASTASAALGQSVAFTATVTDLSPGGPIPDWGTVTFSDQAGVIGSAPLVNGVAEFTTLSLPGGADTVTASYDGTAQFASSTTGTIVTAAGNGAAGYEGDNGPATAAELRTPNGLAIDSAGDVFIADTGNDVVREIVETTGDVITVAGNGHIGYSGDNGPATAAELDGPVALAVDSTGDLFIADYVNNVVREVVKATGEIITFAGNGTAGYSGDGGPATAAELHFPNGLAFDAAGNLFISEAGNNVIREVVKATGDIITFAGNGTAGYSGDRGPATAAELNDPACLAVDSAGDLFIDDVKNNVIREVIRATGDIITFAGNGTAGYSGNNGPPTAAELNFPAGLAIDSAGDVFIDEINNEVVREVVKATGDIITVAGNRTPGYSGDNGPATSAEMDGPTRLSIDSAGDLFLTDYRNNAIREFTTPAIVTVSSSSALPTLTAIVASTPSAALGQSVTFVATVTDLSAGGPIPNGGTVTFSDQAGTIGTANLADGVATLTTSSLGSGADTVSASYGGTTGFAASATGTIVTFAGNGDQGYSGDNGPATAAELNFPYGIVVDSAGDVFFSDAFNSVVREVVKATGDIISVAGNGTAGYSGDNGPATAAELDIPDSLAVDSAGDLFISDQGDNVIREVVKATGEIITVAGNGTAGYGGDNGPATAAALKSPRGIAIDSMGNLFIADCLNSRIREVVKATGDIITVAGNGIAGYSGDGGPAVDAEVHTPSTVAFDSAGDLFLTDYARIREIVKATGDIITVAGNGILGYTGDGGPATAAEISGNTVTVDSMSNLFIADGGHNVVREVVKATGNIITIAGNGTAGYSGDGGPATAAELDSDWRVAVDSTGGVLIGDAMNNVIREATPAAIVKISNSTATTQLVVHVQPSASATAGTPFATQPVIWEENANGVLQSNDDSTVVTASVIGAGGQLQGTTSITLSGGVATFSNLSDDTAGTITLVFTSSALATVESNPINVAPGPVNDVIVKRPPSGIVAGVGFPAEVDAYDAYQNLATGFNGSVTLSVASGPGSLSGTVTMNATNGVAKFANVISDTSGSITIGASASSNGTNITSPPSPPVVVAPGPVDHFVVTTDFPSQDVAGTTGTVTVVAEDQYDNPITSGPNLYVGTIDLASTDPKVSGLPAKYTFTAADAGSFTFSGVALETAGSQTLTATDSVNTMVSGHTAVNVVPAAAYDFVVTTNFPNPDVAGTVGTVTVTAEDKYGNVVGSGPNLYEGTANLVSTDPKTSGLPASYTFTAGDAGTHKFPNVILETVAETGSQTITATDSANSNITGQGTVNVVPAPAQKLMVTPNFPSLDVAGTVGTVTVKALDQYGNIAGSGPNQYPGTVDFVSTDPETSGLPASYTFTAGDAGTHAFSNVILETVAATGSQTITATDSLNNSITGQGTVNVVAAPAQNLVVTPNFPGLDVAGTVGTVTVTALDQYGNIAGSGPNQYPGTVEFVSTDPKTSGLPASYTFTAGDAGTHTFPNVILETVAATGSQTITATDSLNSSITGQGTVNVVPAPAQKLMVTPNFPTLDVAGMAGTVTVTALDQYGNIAGSGPNQYPGTADFVSTDPKTSGLPASYTMTAGDAGTHTFSNVILETVAATGSQTITATDSLNSSITGQAEVNVVPAPVDAIVVTTSFPNPDPAGTVGTVTVKAEDQYGNVAGSGPNQYEDTVDLVSTDLKTAGLPSSYTFSASDGGSHTFISVILKTAANQTITATDSINSALMSSQQIKVNALAADQLVLVVQPPSTVSAGIGFGFQVAAEDMYGNTNTTFTGPVSVVIGTNLGGAALSGKAQATAVAGDANFSGLALSKVGVGYTLKISSGSLTPATTSPITVTGNAPTVIAEHVIALYKLNKKKMPQGKPIGFEYELQYSTPMAASAALPTNYQVEAKTIKNGKTSLTPMSFSENYSKSKNIVTLTVNGTKLFAKGGQINILAASKSGVSSQAGALLNSKYTTFMIAAGGNGITLG
jgi:hypothetical protein